MSIENQDQHYPLKWLRDFRNISIIIDWSVPSITQPFARFPQYFLLWRGQLSCLIINHGSDLVWRMMMPSGKRPPGGTKKSTKWREINDTVFPLLEPWTCIDQASEDWHRRLFLPTRCGKARGLNGFPDYRHLIISLFLMSFQLLPRKAQKYRRCSWVYRFNQNKPSGVYHTHVLNEFSTADCSCITKYFWKNSYRSL